MKLSNIRKDTNPLRVLLSEYISQPELSRICSTIKHNHNVAHNNLLDEGIIGNISKAAILKSKAATMLPAELREDSGIKDVIDMATRSGHSIVDMKNMRQWWHALEKVVISKLPKATIKKYESAIQPILAKSFDLAKNEFIKLQEELGVDTDKTKDERSKKDELAGLEKKYGHEAAKRKLKEKYGIADEEEEGKKKARAKTYARLLDIDPDGDPDTIIDIFNKVIGSSNKGGGGDDTELKRMRRNLLARVNRRDRKASEEEVEEEVSRKGKADDRSAKKGTKIGKESKEIASDIRKLSNNDVMLILNALQRSINPIAEGSKLDKISNWLTSKVTDDGSIGKAGAGLLSLFTRSGRDELGNNIITNAINQYVVAFAIAKVFELINQLTAQKDIEQYPLKSIEKPKVPPIPKTKGSEDPEEAGLLPI